MQIKLELFCLVRIICVVGNAYSTIKEGNIMITLTEHEKREWSRMAQDCYSHGKNFYGHRYSTKAAWLKDQPMDATVFDALQINYRVWLIDGVKVLA